MPRGGNALEILYRELDDPELATLDGYSRRGGYEMLRKALSMDPADVLQEMLDSGVRGRGGAGFATVSYTHLTLPTNREV